MTMIVVGLIGKIGSGKSTVARRLADHGAHVLDADRLAHEVLDEPDVRTAVAARFGADILDDGGRVRRGILAERVFGPTAEHVAALADLEAIVHPRVRVRLHRDIERLRGLPGRPGERTVAVLDVPLLVQSGWADACDQLVVVECADDVRRARLADRGLAPDQQAAREAAWSRSFRPGLVPARKTTAVDASGDLAYTFRQVDRLWGDLQSADSGG
jgi:dephospho-CoA kinase